jgi:hypothetical protein
MAVAFTQGLQRGSNASSPYLETASVARHLIGYDGPEGFDDGERFSFNSQLHTFSRFSLFQY